MSDIPKFQRNSDHEFRAGEEIYVIDPNGYDIWEAEIVDVGEDGYKIHYPEYPDDDTTLDDNSSFLLRTKINTQIFNEQEKIRLRRDAEESDVDFSDEDDDNDYRGKKKKQPKKATKPKKKKEPKAKKPPKEKKKKEPKPPKPKKEKKPKEPKPKAKKEMSEKQLKKMMITIVKKAIQKKIDDQDEFIKFFDKFRGQEGYPDEAMDKISGPALDRFNKNLGGDENLSDAIMETSTDDNDDYSEEELLEFEPEYITLPKRFDNIYQGYEIDVANTAVSFEKDKPFPILFKGDLCNCFLYNTPATQYLIINGMKFELRKKDEEQTIKYLYKDMKLPPHENHVSSSFYCPAIQKIGQMKIVAPPEAERYTESTSKHKVKKVSILPDNDLQLEKHLSKSSSTKKKNNKPGDLSRFLEND